LRPVGLIGFGCFFVALANPLVGHELTLTPVVDKVPVGVVVHQQLADIASVAACGHQQAVVLPELLS